MANSQTDTQKSRKQSAKQLTKSIARRQRRIIGSMYRPLCKILILIGIATILLAVVTIWQYRSSTTRTSRANGTIDRIDKISGIGRDEEGHNAQKCRISYTVNIDGVTYTDTLGYRGDPTTDKCNLSVGDTIEISYDPSHPANNAYAVDDDLSDRKTQSEALGSAGLISLVGIVPIVIGFMGLNIAKRYRENKLDSAYGIEHNQRKRRNSKQRADSA